MFFLVMRSLLKKTWCLWVFRGNSNTKQAENGTFFLNEIAYAKLHGHSFFSCKSVIVVDNREINRTVIIRQNNEIVDCRPINGGYHDIFCLLYFRKKEKAKITQNVRMVSWQQWRILEWRILETLIGVSVRGI